jgi:hypothetical protein
MGFEIRIILLTALFGASLGQLQRAVLYDQYDGAGDYIIIPENYIPDLAQEGFDNRAHSVCVTGVWLFYQDTDYNPNGGRGMEYVFGRDNYCVNIRTIAGTISSVRYAGAPKDYRSDSFTLYEHDYFQGREEYTQNELPNLNLVGSHKSIIITGNNHWTVYDRTNYQGNSLCLKVPDPGNNTPAFVSDLADLDPAIPHGSIRSVRKGCTSPQNVTISSFARMQTSFVPSNAA